MVLAESNAGESVAFWFLAVISVAAALGMILVRKAVHSAMLLAVVMLVLAIFYIINDAPFLGLVQIIVYTGAVLMLFLFVVMIVGVSSTDSLVETIRGQRFLAFVGGLAMVIFLGVGIGHAALTQTNGLAAVSKNGNVFGLAQLIFSRYVFPFEATSALLITAVLGAMVLAHRERTKPKPTQRDLSILRIRGDHPTPLPGPGSYARHNAVDMPALLPDGSLSELSVSPVIARRGIEHISLHGRTPAEEASFETSAVRAVVEGPVAEPDEAPDTDRPDTGVPEQEEQK
jgi:NADH-quinone oxidoreductase subunit J